MENRLNLWGQMRDETSDRVMNWGEVEWRLAFSPARFTQSREVVGFGRAVMTTPPTSVMCLVCTFEDCIVAEWQRLTVGLLPCTPAPLPDARENGRLINGRTFFSRRFAETPRLVFV